MRDCLKMSRRSPHPLPALTSPARAVHAAGAWTKPLSGQRITWKDADVDGPIFGLCSVLTLLSTAIALKPESWRQRRGSDAFRVSRGAHVLALVSSFVGSLLAIPFVAEIVDGATMTELSSLVSDISAMVFCASLQVHGYRLGIRGLPHAVSIACRIAMVVAVSSLLIWQYRRTDPARLDLDLSTSYAKVDAVRTYLLTYLGFFAAAGIEVAARAARLAHGTGGRAAQQAPGWPCRWQARRWASSTP